MQREKNWVDSHDMSSVENKSFLSLVTQDYFGFADLNWRTGFDFSQGVAKMVHDRIESDKKEQNSAFSAEDMVFVSMKMAPETPAATKKVLNQALEFYGSNLDAVLKNQDSEKLKMNDDFIYSVFIITGFEQRKNFSYHSLFILQECLNADSTLHKSEVQEVCSKADYKIKELNKMHPGMGSTKARVEFQARMEYLTNENSLGLKAAADLRNSIVTLSAKDYLFDSFSGNGFSSYGGYDIGKLKKEKELKVQRSGRIEISAEDLQSGVEFLQGDSGSLLTIFGVFPVATLLRAGGEFSSGGWPVQFIPKGDSSRVENKVPTILSRPSVKGAAAESGNGGDAKKVEPSTEVKKGKDLPAEKPGTGTSNSTEPKQQRNDGNVAARDVSGTEVVNETQGGDGGNTCY